MILKVSWTGSSSTCRCRVETTEWGRGWGSRRGLKDAGSDIDFPRRARRLFVGSVAPTWLSDFSSTTTCSSGAGSGAVSDVSSLSTCSSGAGSGAGSGAVTSGSGNFSEQLLLELLSASDSSSSSSSSASGPESSAEELDSPSPPLRFQEVSL